MKTPAQKMEHDVLVVRADWDEEAQVWVATTTDIEGLATEAATLEELRAKVLTMIAELIELNGLRSNLPEIPIHIMAGQTARIRNPHWK